MKLSANVTQGVDRAPNRSLFAALGYTKEETDRHGPHRHEVLSGEP